MKTNLLKWKGTDEELIKLYNENQYKKIIKYFKDNEDFLTMASESNTPEILNQLSETLKWGYAYLEFFRGYVEAHSDNNFALTVALGHLLGVMDLASRVCYIKLENHAVAIKAQAAKKLFDENIHNFSFDGFVKFLYETDDVELEDYIKGATFDQAQFRKELPKLLLTNMFVCRKVDTPYETIELSDDGLLYARYLKLVENPEKCGWN